MVASSPRSPYNAEECDRLEAAIADNLTEIGQYLSNIREMIQE